MVDPIPSDYPQLTPYLCVDGAAAAIEFYQDVLGATVRMQMPGPNDTIGHAELQIGNSVLMLSDPYPDMDVVPPPPGQPRSVTLSLYVDDVYAKALAQGAQGVRPVEKQFYGDRSGQIIDPFGHRWNLSTHVEDVSPEEMERRAAELAGPGAS